MKKKLLLLCTAIIITNITFISCNSAEKKEEIAKEEVNEANEDVREAKKELNEASAEVARVANEEEWAAFKKESETRIHNNESAITMLRQKLKKPLQSNNSNYLNSIDSLNKRNTTLKDRINVYENNKSDWEKFKREYNHDMDALSAAIKDFGVNNKK